MAGNNTILTPEKFHKILHKDIGKPVKDFRERWVPPQNRYSNVHTDAHKALWANAMIFLKPKIIHVQVYINFKKNNLTDADYSKLVYLARLGISKYWSRYIKVDGKQFFVQVQAYHRYVNSIPVDLYVEKDKRKYSRSMNPGVFGIDASFIYNEGAFQDHRAEYDFQLVSAHEFGHSVLMYAGGIGLSWGHKGSTGVLSQSVKSSTPGYPKNGPIDLMKYYDREKFRAKFLRRVVDTTAMEIDIKRLIWGATIRWLK